MIDNPPAVCVAEQHGKVKRTSASSLSLVVGFELGFLSAVPDCSVPVNSAFPPWSD